MKKNVLVITSVLIILLQLILVLASSGQLFHGDEVVFPTCAKAVLETGTPKIENSIVRNETCLWHPPLYVYLMAADASILGRSDFSFRLIGCFCNLLTSIIVLFLAREIFKGNKKRDEMGLLALVLFALNPLTIQNSLITDIDGSILVLAMGLFLWTFFRFRDSFMLVIPLVLVFWSKFSGGVIILASIVLFFVLMWDYRRLVKNILIFIIVVLIFVLTFWIYTNSLSLNFMMPFTHNFRFGGGVSLGLDNLLRSGWVVKTFVYFVSPFLIGLFVWSGFYNIKKIIKKKGSKEDKDILFLQIIGCIVIVLFTYAASSSWGYPKYYASAIAPIAIVIAGFLYNKGLFDIRFNKKVTRYLPLIGILIIYSFLILNNPLIPEFDSTISNANLSTSLVLLVINFAKYILIPLVLALLIVGREKKVLISLFILTMFFYAYICAIHAGANYSTGLKYGDVGEREVLRYIWDNKIPSRSIAAYPHIGYYVGLNNYWDVTALYLSKEVFEDKVVNNPEIQYIIIYERDIDRIGKEELNHFVLKEKMGSYYVYGKRLQV